MPGINIFQTALNVFLKEGRFEFSNSKLSLKQLKKIKDYIKKNSTITVNASSYEIHLNNVELIPFHIGELIDTKGSEDTVLSGDLNEQELPASLKGRFELYSEDKDLRILNYRERSEHVQKIEYEYALAAIEETLLSLFEISKWKVIKLEEVSIADKDNNKQLNFEFVSNLYDTLSPYAGEIKELSLKKVDLFNRGALETFLKKAS